MKKRLSMLVLAAVLLVTAFVPQLAAPPIARAAPAGGAEEKLHYYVTPNNFTTFGSWTLTGSYVTGRSSVSPEEDPEGEPAVVKINIQSAGQYKLWVRDRDYATNQPGTRTFHVEVDGGRVDKKFGTHGKEGFRWTEAGVYTLEPGLHELALIDTSAFFARCEGFFLTKDLSLVPPENKDELLELAQPESPFSFLPPADFPEWATEDVSSVETASIDNGKVKVVFHKGIGQEGDLVQNEIFLKEDGQWLQVKQKTEQLGFLMMAAANSELIGQDGQFAQFRQEVDVEGGTVSAIISDFFQSGLPVWFIPSGFTKLNDHKVELSFSNNSEADLKVIFEFDEQSDDPKVTLEAQFPQNGAYSFLLFNGNETAYNDFDTVTAPLLYVKKKVPDTSTVIPESYLFTPMATLHYAEGNTRFGGKAMTSGIAMDPVSVPQDYAYPETSSFGLVLRGPERDVRPQFTAPMFGSEHSLFEAGDSYSVSYRIINQAASWYDTFKYTAENLYNARDIRTNYFHSLNEAIYNATDLMMDDDYGGWDAEDMAHYNMEEQDLVSLSNSMAALQRYLLTEDEEILDDRAIPTLAYMLGRSKYHFRATGDGETSKYAGELPNPIGGLVGNYSSHVYGGLYEMTQGRMPFLLDRAIQSPSKQSNLTGVADQAFMYKLTEEEKYLNNLVAQADAYLLNNPNTKRETQLTSSFVYGDYIPVVTTLLAAYEATGEQRYLDGAEQNAQLLLTGVWTTGYHDDYAETDYTVTQEKSGTRPLFANRFNFWWHGEQQWRLGNVDGEAKSAQELGVPLETETAPGWLGGRVGMGTEHLVTPGHGNVITMNNWAGMLSKLSVYTGDEFFYNMARNATIGRYGNYPGYYQDRIIFHQMKEDYPYTGPDFTSIYWHHIPVFISMLEDFLINSAWVKSERHVEFPSLYQSGYAYFASNQFGHAPGKFYDEEDMWLWLDRGIVEPDTVEIDYVAARKDGVLGVALMNEGNDAVTSTVTLGEKADPAGSYTGTATVYEADGSTSTVSVVNGAFTLTIPAKGIKSVVLHGLTAVKTPAYANPDFEYSNYTEGTTAEHTRGKAHVIQVTPESYYAYVYATDMNDTTGKMVLNYTIGVESFSAEKTGYPYEFLIKVDDPAKSFFYQLAATRTDGRTEQLGGGELKPYDFSKPGIDIKTEAEARMITVSTWGTYSGMEGALQVSVPAEDFFPLLPVADGLKDLKVTGILTNPADGTAKYLNSVITASQPDSGPGRVTLSIKPTGMVPLADYSGWSISLQVKMPENLVIEHETVAVPVNSSGMNAANNEIRLVVPLSAFPFDLAEHPLNGLRISGTLTHKTDQSVLQLDSVIRRNEPRTETTAVLVVEPTAAVPLGDYKEYKFNVAVDVPKGWKAAPFAAPFDPNVTTIGTIANPRTLKLVAELAKVPFAFMEDSLNGYRIAGEITHKTTGAILKLDSFILDSGLRASNPSQIELVVPVTSRVPWSAYQSAYTLKMTVYPQVVGIWNRDALQEGEFLYKINPAGDTVTITGYTGRGTAEVPAEIAGLPVTGIGQSAFQNKGLTSVSIPPSVETIGPSAFRDNALTQVVLPAQVSSIGDAAFRLNNLAAFTVGGAAAVFGKDVLTSNPAGLTVYGYEGSTAQAYAAANSHSFAPIVAPVIAFQPDGSETWSRTAAVEVAASPAGAAGLLAVWSGSEETPGSDAAWEPVELSGAVTSKPGATGPWYLHIRAEDAGGKPVYGHSRPFLLDNEAPALEVAMQTEDGGLYTPGAWTAQGVTASVYGSDNHSGLAALLVSRDGGEQWTDMIDSLQMVLEEEGIHSLRFKAVDHAGNEEVAEHTVKISKSGLQLAATLRRADGGDYASGSWSRQPVTVEVYAANIHGPAVTLLDYSPDGGASWQPYGQPLVYSQDGEYGLWLRVEDELGHGLTEQAVIRIDQTAPAVTLTPQGNVSASREDTVTAAVYDGGSGVAADSLMYVWAPGSAAPGPEAAWRSFAGGGAVPLPQAEGDWYLHVKARDVAGNETEQASSLFRVIPPPGSGSEGGEGGEGGSGEEGGSEGEEGTSGQEGPSGQTPGGNQPGAPGESSQAPGGSGTESGGTGGSQPEAPAAAFPDLAGHWAEELVREMAGLGIIGGYPDGSLQPDRSITRAEFIAAVVRALKAGTSGAAAAFSDAQGHWAEPAIAAAYALGWTGGVGENRFGPDEAITREQMLVILMRALKAPAASGAAASFADAGSISDWANSAIAAAVELGIAQGYPDGTIRPAAPASRAEALAVLARALKQLEN